MGGEGEFYRQRSFEEDIIQVRSNNVDEAVPGNKVSSPSQTTRTALETISFLGGGSVTLQIKARRHFRSYYQN